MSNEPAGTLDDFGSHDADLHATTPVDPSNDQKTTKASDEDDDLKRVKRSQWSLMGPGQFLGAGRTLGRLIPGVYSISDYRGEPLFVRRSVSVDALMEFPDSKTDGILKEIEDFWTKGDLFEKYGFLHRRGYLLYGPPGSGKTCLVQQVIARITGHEGIVFLCEHPKIFLEGLSVFREVEPNRPVVCIFEDIDAIIARYQEDVLLSVLDGENQIDKVLNIATTNYPEKLDKRIISRPRRFDRVMKIDMPSDEVRTLYFKQKLGIDDAELKMWVDNTKNFSFAGMSELVISVKCLGNDFKKAVVILDDLLNKKKTSKDYSVTGIV